MFRIIMTLWKIVQRHTYDLLSHKYSVIIILISFSTILVSVIQFGEVWMTWSQEKYDAVFNSFSDNIVRKSLQNKLCQNVPIDVVYTWVNGSDPILLHQLQQYRLQLQEETSKRCPYTNCVPSHLVTFRHWLSDDNILDALLLPALKGANVSLRHRVRVLSNNWTLIEFQSSNQANEVVKHVIHSNMTLHHAHWTTDSTAPNSYGEINAVLISGIPDILLQEAGSILHGELTEHLQAELQNIWVYSEKKLVVAKLDSAQTVNKTLQLPNNLTIVGQMVNISKAYLIMELPLIGNSKDFSPSRFEDKEELRYSLRSLEKFAPWVRHVYLVTNGQIPYWLDLENPRLTIITHDKIFPNSSHLPTFSSPAIESHIHRIPGLSQKFLYLNDDVMFGKEVWPDDFITKASGQKVYLSWPVPDCSDSCPWSWVADGSCDMSCNTSECSFDGGDCDLSVEEDLGLYDENRHLANYDDDINSYNENQHHHAHDSINDNLFRNMNFGGDIVLEDLPDPGQRMNSLLDILIKKNVKKDKVKGNLTYFREIEDVGYLNAKGNGNVDDGDYTTPLTYNLTFTKKKHGYETLKLNSEMITNQTSKNLQQNLKDHRKEENHSSLAQRTVQFGNIWNNKSVVHITSSVNSSVMLGLSSLLRQNGSNTLKIKEGNNDSVFNNENITQSYVQKLFGNNNTDLNEYHMDDWNDTEGHGEFYPRLAKKDVNFIKLTELKQNRSRMFGVTVRGQNEKSLTIHGKNFNRNIDYNPKTHKVRFNESQNLPIATKSSHISETEKVFNSHIVKPKSVRNVSYSAKLQKLYQRLNGKADEPERLHGKYNAASVDKNVINPPKQHHSDYEVDWKSEEKISKVTNNMNAKKKQKTIRVYDAQQYGNSPSPGKKPRDTFAESLLYVNRLYNQEFGFEPRKVPAHMPHLIDIDIMERLQLRFSSQWQLTSSHRVRNAHDMQFAFSYFYFLMSCKEILPLSEIFDLFDTDHSGTWSDREIRTLLTRSYELPLSYARVVKFENDIINCSRDLPVELSNVHMPTPPYERYQDSKLPVVSKTLILNCKPIADMLKKKFGNKKQYQYQIERDKHQDVSFKMLNSNISQMVSHLDDIRRDPKKFICLNDNLDPEREEDNTIARAILQDMYESLFPQPSTFELPPEFRNRFLHMSELQAWRASRNTIRTIVYICLAILIAFTLINFFHMECRWLQRRLFHRTRQHYHQDIPSVPCV